MLLFFFSKAAHREMMVAAEKLSGPSPAQAMLPPALCGPTSAASLSSMGPATLTGQPDFGQVLGIIQEFSDLPHMFLLYTVLPIDFGKEDG